MTPNKITQAKLTSKSWGMHHIKCQHCFQPGSTWNLPHWCQLRLPKKYHGTTSVHSHRLDILLFWTNLLLLLWCRCLFEGHRTKQHLSHQPLYELASVALHTHPSCHNSGPAPLLLTAKTLELSHRDDLECSVSERCFQRDLPPIQRWDCFLQHLISQRDHHQKIQSAWCHCLWGLPPTLQASSRLSGDEALHYTLQQWSGGTRLEPEGSRLGIVDEYGSTWSFPASILNNE